MCGPLRNTSSPFDLRHSTKKGGSAPGCRSRLNTLAPSAQRAFSLRRFNEAMQGPRPSIDYGMSRVTVDMTWRNVQNRTMVPSALFCGMPHKGVHLAHWIYPGGIECRCQFDGIKRHVVSNRSQRHLSDVPRNNSRRYGNVSDRLGRQQLPRRCECGDARCDVDCRTKEVVRSAEYWTVVKPGPRQWNPWLGSAGWKQTSEHLKGGCRVRKSKHRFVTDPLDRRRDPSQGLAHQLLEALQHCYCRRRPKPQGGSPGELC